VGVDLAFAVPEEGSIVWFDGWVIPKYAKNVKAARYFINFLCKPENAIRNMDEIGYVSAIGGEEIMEAAVDSTLYAPQSTTYFFGPEATALCVNPVLYPSDEIVNRCGMMHDSGERTEALLAMWSRVKGDNASVITYVIIGVAIVAIAVAVIMMRNKNSRKHRRKSRR